ncbi:MAG: hypoxanthine phosphoribosyltransferase [Deltaproteobacteria bacterium]|nr:hypoxanthine phosphoribosyltransferase [Deltaproteobacteria bacterium]
MPIPDTLIPAFSREQIAVAVETLARRISADYAGRDLLLVGVLKGSFMFLADLVRALTIPAEVDFVRLASYGAGIASSGAVQITKDLETTIEGRDVIVVEDIVDTGQTLRFLLDLLRLRHPPSLKVCALVDKPGRRAVEVPVDYVGFPEASGFLVGYGLDLNERYRLLPAIYRIEGAPSLPDQSAG